MVEHQNHNLLVEGSSPPLATIKKTSEAFYPQTLKCAKRNPWQQEKLRNGNWYFVLP